MRELSVSIGVDVPYSTHVRVFGVVALIWLLVAARFLRDVRAMPSLPRRVMATAPHERVSVVIAARDEEARIETTDRTGEIVQRVAAEHHEHDDPRIR